MHCGSVVFLGILGLILPAWTEGLPAWDFRREDTTAVWGPLHAVQIQQDAERGLVLNLTGEDPYCGSGPLAFPEVGALWMEIEIRSQTGGLAQLFFNPPGSGFSEDHSVRFSVPKDTWTTLKVPIPSLAPNR